jgi:pimeloyl-ACP methyl ester carboxylesterase
MSQTGAPWKTTRARTVRRGHFWIPGERVAIGDKSYQRGPMYVEWEAPERVTRQWPIVLLHGGGFQGTEWFDTPDGRPGWAQRLVEAGYAVLVVDRPGHGRSPFHVDTMGHMGPPFSYEGGRQIYFPGDDPRHTQWPFAAADASAMDEFIAGYGPLPADLEASENMDADRTAALLDRIGPAILITHSASGPDGWLVADRRPHLVKAIAAIEPMGPPFAEIPNIGPMRWGPAAAGGGGGGGGAGGADRPGGPRLSGPAACTTRYVLAAGADRITDPDRDRRSIRVRRREPSDRRISERVWRIGRTDGPR